MRILLITSSFLPSLGGAEIGLHNIAVQLLKKGHEPTVLAPFSHVQGLKRKGWELPYPVLSIPPRLLHWYDRFPKMGTCLLEWFFRWVQSRHQFDFWHATFGYPVGIVSVKFCRKRQIPHLVRCVGEDIQQDESIGYGMRLDPRIDRRICEGLNDSQVLVATTETVKKEYEAIGISDDKIAMIPNGVELSRFSHFDQNKKSIREKLGFSGDDFVCVCVGRFHPKKNFHQILDAAEAIKKEEGETSGIRFLIGGKGVGTLNEMIESRGLNGIVKTIEPDSSQDPSIGYVPQFPSDQVLEWYSAGDVFLMPSLIETFGIVTVEAMAMGLPVIAADAPGSRDILEGSKFGILYDGSVDGLLSSLSSVRHSPSEIERLKKCSEVRSQDFDWSEIVGRYLEVYQGRNQ
tara:strand:+ start:43 stop:1251 length:1209 start_codon:yes stop_codon:yes gene_type:complete